MNRGTPARLRSRLFALVMENWSLKLISFITSLILYIVLHGSSDSQRTMDVDVIALPPRDPAKMLLTPLPQRVHVTVQGPRSLLDELPNSIEPLTVDLTNEIQNIIFEEAQFSLPTGVRKVHVVPPYLTLRWDVKVTRPIKVDVASNPPPDGLALRDIVAVPPFIGVTGPKTRVDLIQHLRTAPLELAHRAEGPDRQNLLIDVLTDPALSSVQLESDSVEAIFRLVPETKTRTFSNIPVVVLAGKGAVIRPRVVSVIATCPPALSDDMSNETVVPKVDLGAVGPEFGKRGAEEAPVKVDLPGCSEVVLSPPRVTVPTR